MLNRSTSKGSVAFSPKVICAVKSEQFRTAVIAGGLKPETV